MILICKCEHKDQDAMYGKQRRVHNAMRKEKTYKCTVCEDVKSF